MERAVAGLTYKQWGVVDEALLQPRKLCRLSRNLSLLTLRRSYPDEIRINGEIINAKALLDYAGSVIDSAVHQCLNLDFFSVLKGAEPYFLEDVATFHELPTLREIHCLAWRRVTERLRAKKPCHKTYEKVDVAAGKELARLARELRRSGASIPWTRGLLRYQFRALHFTKKMNVELEAALHDTQGHSHRYKGSDGPAFLAGIWLPLRIWECPRNGRDAFRRIEIADKAFGRRTSPFGRPPAVKSHPKAEIWLLKETSTDSHARPPADLVKALGNFRDKYLKPGRDSLANFPELSA